MAVREKAFAALRSPKLAVILLLALALLAVLGTVLPPDDIRRFYGDLFGDRLLPAARAAGLIDTYSSPPFLFLSALLCLNIVYCTWHRFSLRRSALARGKGKPGRRRLLWLDAFMHLAILVIIAGGVGKSLWGFIGTQYLLVGVETEKVYDWKSRAEAPLGFTLLLKEKVDDYLPLRLRVGVSDLASGEKLDLLEVKEGGSAALRDGNLKLGVKGYDPESGAVSLEVEREGRREVFSLSVKEGEQKYADFPPYRLTLVAFMHIFKRTRGRVAFIEEGRQVKEEWLEPNGRIAHRGLSIFQSTWGNDPYGNPYIGIQVARDPAAPVFWVGCILFSVALPLYFYFRHGRS